MKLGVLELGTMHPPETYAHDVIQALFDEVAMLEEAGYERFWLAEHYAEEFAWYNPEMLLPLLAGSSERIKIGLAGVLLYFHSPLRVYQAFRQLTALFPDRIDLGLARAGVSDDANFALRWKKEQPTRQEWDDKVTALFDIHHQRSNTEKDFLKKQVPPHGTAKPNVWMLGVSPSSIPKAVEEEAYFSISMIHPGANPEANKSTLTRYREEFFKKHGEIPQCNMAISINSYNKDFEGLDISDTPKNIAQRLLEVSEAFDCPEIILVEQTRNRKQRIENLIEIEKELEACKNQSLSFTTAS